MTNIANATAEAIKKAAEMLANAELVAFPTETVYGLGADATSDTAVAKIYTAKGRPSFNPLICHFSDIQQVEKAVDLSWLARELATAFWPGPLTLVLPRKEGSAISQRCSPGLATLAVRIPSHPVARQLLEVFGKPIAAPSANRSGKISPTTAQAVWEELGEKVPMILDGGTAQVGLESTVISLVGPHPVLLRPGFIDRAKLDAITGPLQAVPKADKLLSPGLLQSHYAPSCPVRLHAENVAADEALLAFGGKPLTGARKTLNLSASGNLEEAAANLYSYLRALDTPGIKAIAVMPIPTNGIGEAINDRLRRAAASKEQ
jgi:L-threonylcarbamoyladenylate synthase